MSALWKPAYFPTLPTPVTLRFKDQASALEALVGFVFRPCDFKTPCMEGWVVVRIEKQLGIVEARVCPAWIGYKSPLSSENFVGGRYHPTKMPDCYLNFRQTLNDWIEQFPDCLVREVPKASTVTQATPSAPVSYGPPYFVSNEVLMNLVDTSHFFFEELQAMREKTIPWPQRDFMDFEAVLAGVANAKNFGWLNRHAQKQLAHAARAGREPEECVSVQQSIEKLKKFGCDAAWDWNKYYHASQQKDFVAGAAAYEEEAWLERMRAECPGFSDWVYKGAIHDYGQPGRL